jgi:hypothetical protein
MATGFAGSLFQKIGRRRNEDLTVCVGRTAFPFSEIPGYDKKQRGRKATVNS